MTAQQTAFVPFHRSPPGMGAARSRPERSTARAPAVTSGPRRRPRGRPRKTAQERSDGNRRRQLMDGAAQLFRSKGFAATGTRDIAAAAGMHSRSPFYHFASKSAPLFAVMNEGMASAVQSQQQALAVLAPPAPAREGLRLLLHHHLHLLPLPPHI